MTILHTAGEYGENPLTSSLEYSIFERKNGPRIASPNSQKFRESQLRTVCGVCLSHEEC